MAKEFLGHERGLFYVHGTIITDDDFNGSPSIDLLAEKQIEGEVIMYSGIQPVFDTKLKMKKVMFPNYWIIVSSFESNKAFIFDEITFTEDIYKKEWIKQLYNLNNEKNHA